MTARLYHLWDRGFALAQLGESDAMFDCLQVARSENRINYPKVEPLFDPYRSDPRFQAILEGMGLAD